MNIQTLPQEGAGDGAPSRSQRLRAATHPTHEILDKRIMSADPFGSRERYGMFLKIQFDFHLAIDDLYDDGNVASVISDIGSRRRLDLIRQDIVDIGGQAPSLPSAPDEPIHVPTAFGWLYVAEGSNLGAAFLLKEARKLGLSESFGARHLAGNEDGRGLHWRRFTAALDAAAFDEDEDRQVVEGAQQAFDRVLSLVERTFPQ